MALRVTPVPIPNTKVKPYRADGTAGAALWKSRLLPCQKNTKQLLSIFFRLIIKFCLEFLLYCHELQDQPYSHKKWWIYL